MTVRVQTEDFDAGWEINQLRKARKDIGAVVSFIGLVRDVNEGDAVSQLTLEHYPGMTEKQLAVIVTEAETQWPILDTLVVHKVGDILPNQPIVLVAVWTSHRGDAFDACRYIMEALKFNLYILLFFVIIQIIIFKKNILLRSYESFLSNSPIDSGKKQGLPRKSSTRKLVNNPSSEST